MRRVIFTTLFVVCAGLPVWAAELVFSASGEVEYDDNVFRSEEDKDDDVLFRLRPGVRVQEDRGDDLNYSVGYEAPVEFSVDNSSDLNDVDHIGSGEFSYHVNDRLEFFGGDTYGYLRSTLRNRGADTDSLELAGGTVEFTDERDRVKTNSGSLGTLYRFSPRTVGRVTGSTTYFDSSREDRARVWSASGVADMQYRYSLKHQLGVGGGYTFQDFDDRVNIPGSQTQIYRVFGSWRWMVTETLSLDTSAGPAYLETDQDNASRTRFESAVPFGVDRNDGSVFAANFASCPIIGGFSVSDRCSFDIPITNPADFTTVTSSIPVTNLNPGGEDDTELTVFADVTLAQRWSPTLASALHYTRTQGDGSGVGGTVIVDSISLSNFWDFAERWSLSVRGDYVRRNSAFDIAQTYDIVTPLLLPGGTDPVAARTGAAFNSTQKVRIDTDGYGVAGRITHHLFKTTSIYVQARYSQQDSRSSSLGADSDYESFLATFGVQHVFEPIPLW